jgi:methylated-DNA-[protein]-cysteine S-methyltransferase
MTTTTAPRTTRRITRTTNEVTPITTTIPSPIGPLTLSASGGSLTGLSMDGQRHLRPAPPSQERDDAWFADIVAQIDAYFSGTLTEFEIPIRLEGGTEFQQSVWEHLLDIPYGTTISYGELAHRVGNPNASRAVGLANGRNPIALIVPCHRVIGSNGQLTGYGGGLDRKSWLLEHEAPHG